MSINITTQYLSVIQDYDFFYQPCCIYHLIEVSMNFKFSCRKYELSAYRTSVPPHNEGGHSGAVVTRSPPTSEVGGLSPSRYFVVAFQ